MIMLSRVLHLRSSGGLLGAENVIIELAKHSSLFGYESIIGAIKNVDDPFPDFITYAQELKIPCVIFEGNGRIDFRRAGEIKNYISNNSIDILHCHGYKEDFYGIVSNVKIPKVATNHLWKRGPIKEIFYETIDALFLRFFDRVVGVSDEIVNIMRNRGVKSPVLIPNGIDIKRFTIKPKSKVLLKKYSLKENAIIIGMVSTLSPEKGHKYSIQAMKNVVDTFPETCLFIVGEGPLKGQLIQLVEKLNLESNVIFVGKQNNIPEILSIIDIFLMSSLAEGLPMALLEAMASGKAVVATDVGENGKVISYGENGYLVSPFSVEEIEKVLTKLISNKSEIQKLGTRARECVVEKYPSELMSKAYCDLYDSVLDKETFAQKSGSTKSDRLISGSCSRENDEIGSKKGARA